MNTLFGFHESSCTSEHPCYNCQIEAFLKASLTESAYAKISGLFAKKHAAEGLPVFYQRIDTLDFDTRAKNALKAEGIYFVGELVQRSEEDIEKLYNIGRKTAGMIKIVLYDNGLCFNMKLANWKRPKLPWETE